MQLEVEKPQSMLIMYSKGNLKQFKVLFSSLIYLLVCCLDRNAPVHRKQNSSVKGKDWILKKKERMRKQGKLVAQDSKYTARKRKPKF